MTILDLHLQITWNPSIYLRLTIFFVPLFQWRSFHKEICIDFNYIYYLLLSLSIFLKFSKINVYSLLWIMCIISQNSLSLSLKVTLLRQIYGRFRPCSFTSCYRPLIQERAIIISVLKLRIVLYLVTNYVVKKH